MKLYLRSITLRAAINSLNQDRIWRNQHLQSYFETIPFISIAVSSVVLNPTHIDTHNLSIPQNNQREALLGSASDVNSIKPIDRRVHTRILHPAHFPALAAFSSIGAMLSSSIPWQRSDTTSAR